MNIDRFKISPEREEKTQKNLVTPKAFEQYKEGRGGKTLQEMKKIKAFDLEDSLSKTLLLIQSAFEQNAKLYNLTREQIEEIMNNMKNNKTEIEEIKNMLQTNYIDNGDDKREKIADEEARFLIEKYKPVN